MDIPVAVFVLCVVGAAALGLLLGGLYARRIRRKSVQTLNSVERALAEARSELAAANRDLMEAGVEISRLDAAVAEAEQQTLVRSGDADIARRELIELRRRFTDIVGLEAEIATLRVIAAKVSPLEARLARIESQGSVIDLRDTTNNPVPTEP